MSGATGQHRTITSKHLTF